MFEADEQLLRTLARQCKDAKEKIRLLALHALSIGKSLNLVAEIFCVDEDTLRNWVRKWGGEKSLKDAPRDGRPPSLTDVDKKEIKKLVEENNPKKHGLNASAWDCNELRKYFARKGKIFSIDVIRKALKEMGARYVKAIIQFAEADENERMVFAKSFVKAEKSAKAIIFFEDEMSVETKARKGYGWTFEKRLVVVAPQRGRKRLNLFGAVSLKAGEIIQWGSKSAKKISFVKFLGKIWVKHPRKLVWVYLDNLPVHKSGKVKEFLENHPNIQLRYFPKYSPELNPREYWHNFLRKKCLNNTSSKNPQTLMRTINTFTRNTPKNIIQRICTLKPIYALA